METLLYTLVALVILGTVLSFAVPKLQQQQERALVAEEISTLKELDALIADLASAPGGTSRSYEVLVPRGTLVVDGEGDLITFEIPEVNVRYSEPGVGVQDGRVQVLTTAVDKKTFRVTLTLDYQSQGMNLTLEGTDGYTEFTAAPTPYKLQFSQRQLLNSQGKLVRTVQLEQVTSVSQSVPMCGNAIVERNEQCDDGNATYEGGNGACSARKRCSEQCTLNQCPYTCGNGIWEFMETCDNGQGCEAGKYCSIFSNCQCFAQGSASEYILELSISGDATTISDNFGRIHCNTKGEGTCSAAYSQGTRVALSLPQTELATKWAGCYGSDSYNCLAYPGERCDSGSTPSRCITDISVEVRTMPYCGNGKVDSQGETCDDGDAGHGGGNGLCSEGKKCGSNCVINSCNAVCTDSDGGDAPLVGGTTTRNGVAYKDSTNKPGQAPGDLNEFRCEQRSDLCLNSNVCLCKNYYICDKSTIDAEGEARCEASAFTSFTECFPN